MYRARTDSAYSGKVMENGGSVACASLSAVRESDDLKSRLSAWKSFAAEDDRQGRRRGNDDFKGGPGLRLAAPWLHDEGFRVHALENIDALLFREWVCVRSRDRGL